MGELTGGRVNYYLAKVDHPQREEQPAYQAECEDIIAALKMDFNQACEFKAIWRTASAALGKAKQGHKALYDAQKRVHYATRSLTELQREANAELVPEPAVEVLTVPRNGEHLGEGWFVHRSESMPEALDPEDLVEVELLNGIKYTGNFAKHAKDWMWKTDPVYDLIVAWRLLKVEQEKPELDDWKVHDTYHIPDGLDPDEMVEVKVDDDVVILMAKRAQHWDWKYRSAGTPAAAPHITHWRRYRHGA